MFQASQQDGERVVRWREQDSPALRDAAARVEATIYFADEAGIRSDYHAGTTWAPVGQTPVVTSTGTRYAVNMISAVTPQGKLRFSTFTGTLDTEIFVSFCRRLLHDTPGPVFLIVDGHPVHRPRAVITFRIHRPAPAAVLPPALLAQAQPRRIGVEKRQTRRIGKAGVRSAEDLRHKAENALCRLQRPPNLVRAFFLNPHTRYAHAV